MTFNNLRCQGRGDCSCWKSENGSWCTEHSLGSAKLLFGFTQLPKSETKICIVAKDCIWWSFCLGSALLQKELDLY